MKTKTVIFDFDSTLVSIEGIDELARISGNFQKVALLTQKAMNGNSNFESIFTKRLEIVKPTTESLNILANLYLQSVLDDAAEMINVLKLNGIEVLIITGGYRQAVLPTTRFLGIADDNVYAIKLAQDEWGYFTQVASDSPLKPGHTKADCIKKINPLRLITYIGDGYTDLQAKDVVDCFIGFGGVTIRSEVKSAALHYVTDASLLSIVKYIN